MDIDRLFKVPKLPTGGNKRRMPDMPSAEVLKRMRLDSEGSSSVTNVSGSSVAVQSPSKPKSRRATVEDANEDEEMDMGEDGDREFAPGGDADYFAEEDDEGRFFGGGLTKEQKDILAIFEKAAGQDGVQDESAEDMSLAHIRRLLTRFERAANKNQEQRAKYADDPTKFIDSEADLDSAIKALLPLAQVPTRAYPEIAKGGGAARLASLLSHENADIALDVIELIHELTDEDTGDDVLDDEDDGEDYSRDEALKMLVDAFLETSILELLVQNFDRLNESEEADRQGVFQIMGIFENVLSINPQLAHELVARTSLMKWLLQRVEAKAHDENRGYAAELLAILLQDNTSNRLQFGQLDGVDKLLTVLSQYRKRDPRDADETEFMENLFDVLCSALAETEIKKSFLKAEGVDLMVLMMKEKMQSRSRSIKVLDYALSGPTGSANCEAFVEALGLKTLFPALMGKQGKKGKSAQPVQEDTAHVLGVISSLLSNLASGTASRMRLLTKFVDSGCEKVDRLLELREGAETRLAATEREIDNEKKQLAIAGEEIGQNEEDLWDVRRLDGGLFTLQTVDYILGWICMEDDGIRAHVQSLLSRKNKTLKDIVKVLQIFRDNATDEADLVLDNAGEPVPTQRMILTELAAFLDAC